MADGSLIRYEEVDKKVRAYTHHAFLQASDVRPYASRFHFDLARAILQQARLSRNVSVAVLEAVLLLHRGLSIHEEVDHTLQLQRQLRVLAGDYCSSQYYFIISKVGNQQLVQALSDSVVRINEAKMTLYRHIGSLSAKEYMTLQEVIHGDLLITLARCYLGMDDHWLGALRSAIDAYVVHWELKAQIPDSPLSPRQALEWLNQAKDELFQGSLAAIVQPIRSFVLDTWDKLQSLLEEQSLAEGNR